jgi:hypothetical protein
MCSTLGLRNFPLLNTVTVTDDLKKQITEQLDLEIQWGPRSTEPRFDSATPRIDQGYLEYYDSGDQTTTLRLHGNSYVFMSLQLSTPNHRSYLPQSKQTDCSGELTMAFRATNLTLAAEAFIFVCVPILARVTATPNVYLKSLRVQRLPGAPLTLETILPTRDQHYLTYSTCMNLVQPSQTYPVQVRVLVFTDPIEIAPNEFNDIATASNGTRVASLPNFYLPFGLNSPSGQTRSTIGDSVSFARYLRYSLYKKNGSSTATSSQRRDNLNSYKCVPLLPEQNVKDGTIVVDTDTGQLLSQVLDDKQADAASGLAPVESPISPAVIQKIGIISLAIFILVGLFAVIGYYMMRFLSPNTDEVLSIPMQKVSTWGPTAAIAIVLGVIGFVIGKFV